MNIESYIRKWSEMVVESEDDYSRAKKLGYMGSQDNVAEWLKGDYAKWKQHLMDVFMRLSNGDEDKAREWFRRYNTLATSMVGMRFGSKDGYVDSEDMKNDLAKELGDDEEAKELIKKIDDKWKNDTKSLIEFYNTSNWTGD